MYRVEIEDVVANYFIYHLLLNNTSKFVRFATLLDYGITVVDELNKNKKPAIFDYNRESNYKFFRDHSDFFEYVKDSEGYSGIMLRDGITRLDLIIRFLGVIPIEVQKVLEEVLKGNK